MRKDIKKLTYSDVIESIYVICIGNGGYEYIANDHYNEGKFDFETKSTCDREDKAGIREANKVLGQWKKGLRKIIKMAKKGPGGINLMAAAYTGNGAKTKIDWFWKLYNGLSHDDLIKLGGGDETIMTESYVNGTVDVWLK